MFKYRIENATNTNIEYHYLVPTIQIVQIIRDNTALHQCHLQHFSPQNSSKAVTDPRQETVRIQFAGQSLFLFCTGQ